MPLQIIDYTKAPILREPDLIASALSGFKAGAEPAKMGQEKQQRELANSLQKLALEHKPQEYALADALKNAQINKLNRPPSANTKTNIIKPNGKVANIAWVHDQLQNPNLDPTYRQQLEDSIKIAQTHEEATTANTVDLTNRRGFSQSTPITKEHLELKQVQEGFYPGTKEKISPAIQNKMTNDLMLSIAKKKTDPLTREKLINGTNLNITMDSINPDKLFQYSGAKNAPRKIADAIKEGFGTGSQNYKDYIGEVNKAIGSAKQLRQYLKDSIQPSNAEKLEHLTNPEAWNVSPELAKKNFLFMKDLLKKETNTLVRAANDASLYESEHQASQPAQTAGKVLVYNPATGRME